MAEHVTRNVVLDEKSIEIVDCVVEDRGLGGKGFSAALRMIIREWAVLNQRVGEIVAKPVEEKE